MPKKVLIDYDEYVRLTKAANLCEEMLKKKNGGGYLSEIISTKENLDAVNPPIAGEIGSITTPPNAVIDVPKVNDSGDKKKHLRRTNEQPNTKRFVEDKWYVIGKPT